MACFAFAVEQAGVFPRCSGACGESCTGFQAAWRSPAVGEECVCVVVGVGVCGGCGVCVFVCVCACVCVCVCVENYRKTTIKIS